jgi:hypothetical protein
MTPEPKIYADTPVPYALAYLAEEIVHWCAPQAEELARLTQYESWRDALETALHRHRDCECGAAVWMCVDCANGRDVGHSHAECGACADCLAAEEQALAEDHL